MKIATIIPLRKGVFKEDLSYFTGKDVKNGSIVSISVKSKKILGLVAGVEDATSLKSGIKDMPFKLKKIIEIKKHSIFRNEFIESALSIGHYFAAPKNNVITSLIPSVFREKYDELEKFRNKSKEENYSQNIKNEKLLLQTNLEDRLSFYKTLIRGHFALKKSVFIVLPTEYDIAVFHQALGKGIENFTFFIYSGLNPKKTIEKYGQIMNSEHGVLVLCTAQFLSIPRKDVGAIIVEHESSSAYKMIPRPHLDLRLFAEIYASKINAKFILGDTLLRYETIMRMEKDGFAEIYPLSFRTNFNGEIEVLKKEKGEKKFSILNDEVIAEIQNVIKNKKRVFVFSLRKGLATYTVCKDCNETINCDKCLAPLVLYISRDGKKRMFVCNRCNTEKDSETKCANCGGWNLMPLGIGTDTVFEEIKKKFNKTKIFKLDKESVKTGKAAEKIAKEFEKSPGSILIGTEMAFFYLKEKADLSVIASFDSLWSIPNFKMGEKIVQLLLSIISKTEKKIIIQTKNERDPALLAIKSENLLSFVREELEDRKNLNYPPFKRFIKITYLCDKNGSIEARKTLRETFKEYSPEIFGGFMAKNKNKYVTNALIKLEPKKWPLPELSPHSSIDENLSNLLSSLPPSFEVSVDPEDLL